MLCTPISFIFPSAGSGRSCASKPTVVVTAGQVGTGFIGIQLAKVLGAGLSERLEACRGSVNNDVQRQNLEAIAGQVDLVRQDVNDTTKVHSPVLLTNSSCVDIIGLFFERERERG